MSTTTTTTIPASRRWRLGILAVAVTALVTSCDNGNGTALWPDESVPTTQPASPDVELSGDPQSPFISVDTQLVVTAGREVYRRVDEPHGYMPPLPAVPTSWEAAELTPEGFDELLRIAGELGFLDTPPDYGDYDVTDSNMNDVIVTTANTVYTHAMYHPQADVGDREANAARARFREMVDTLGHLEDHLGDGIGPFEPYIPQRWEISIERDGGPTSGPWPFTEPPVAGCTEFPTDEVIVDGVDHAAGRYEVESDADATVFVQPLLPWEHC